MSHGTYLLNGIKGSHWNRWLWRWCQQGKGYHKMLTAEIIPQFWYTVWLQLCRNRHEDDWKRDAACHCAGVGIMEVKGGSFSHVFSMSHNFKIYFIFFNWKRKFKFTFGFPGKWRPLEGFGHRWAAGSIWKSRSDPSLTATVSARRSFRREPPLKPQSRVPWQWRSGTLLSAGAWKLLALCFSCPICGDSSFVWMATPLHWPEEPVFQHSLLFKLKLIMPMINYSTKAQRSRFLTSVLLISFCSVLRSIFSVFLWKKKKKYVNVNTFSHIQTFISIFRSRHIVSVPWANLDMWPGIGYFSLYSIILHFYSYSSESKSAQRKPN